MTTISSGIQANMTFWSARLFKKIEKRGFSNVRNVVTVTSDDEKYAAFARKINADKDYSQPLLDSNLIEEKLDRAIHNTDDRVLAVIENGDITGLFVLLVIDDEKYVEITMGLSKSKEAYAELFDYLSQYFNGYQIDFSFNPCNEILRNILKEKSAVFRVEQQKMVLKRIPETTDMSGVESIDDQYTEGYLAIHDTSNYWTGERVLEDPDRFHVLVAVEEHKVVGYLDLTKNYDENEPYDVFVKEECRRKGYGKKLLAKAIELNKPKGMSLMVDVDNVPAIRLYTSMGFEEVEGQNCIYATWQVY